MIDTDRRLLLMLPEGSVVANKRSLSLCNFLRKLAISLCGRALNVSDGRLRRSKSLIMYERKSNVFLQIPFCLKGDYHQRKGDSSFHHKVHPNKKMWAVTSSYWRTTAVFMQIPTALGRYCRRFPTVFTATVDIDSRCICSSVSVAQRSFRLLKRVTSRSQCTEP